MASNFLKKLFGDTSQKEIRKIMPLVEKIESLEAEYKALSDEQLQAKTPWLKSRLSRARLWTISCPRPLPPFVRQTAGFWASSPSGCSSSAALSSIRAVSPK